MVFACGKKRNTFLIEQSTCNKDSEVAKMHSVACRAGESPAGQLTRKAELTAPCKRQCDKTSLSINFRVAFTLILRFLLTDLSAASVRTSNL
jgi:hypothetical protein